MNSKCSTDTSLVNPPSPARIPVESIKAVVLDCDGVLFDSKEANVRFYSHILEQVGCPPVRPDQHEFIHMHPVKQSLEFLTGNAHTFERAWRYAQKIDYSAFNSHLRCEPGLTDFLKQAKSNYKTALATNRTVSTLQLLAYFKLDVYFDLVVSASDVRFPKPHPEAMEKILATFDLAPDQVLFVGDSVVDERFAEAARVYFAAYKNPQLKAHLRVQHFRELQAFLFGSVSQRSK